MTTTTKPIPIAFDSDATYDEVSELISELENLIDSLVKAHIAIDDVPAPWFPAEVSGLDDDIAAARDAVEDAIKTAEKGLEAAELHLKTLEEES
jgi:hypothetical protein